MTINDTTTTNFAWRCNVCRRPVADGAGYIHADWGAAYSTMLAYHADEQANGGQVVSIAELIAFDTAHPEANWEVHHRRCDPHPQRDDYWFDVGRARTLDEVLDWNTHLADKNWVAYTNWARWLQHSLT